MLTHEMTRQGTFLFKWRSYLPLLGFPLVVLAMANFRYPLGSHSWDVVWDLVSLALAFSGLAVRILTIGFVHPGTSGRSTKHLQTHRLNTAGAYSLVRHPLYLGNLLIVAGGSLFARHLWLSLVVVLGFALYYERIIAAEESYLLEKFGAQFVEWARRTHLVVPSFKNYRPPERAFDWRMVLRREQSGFFGIVASFTFLETLGDYVVHRRVVLDPLWLTIFCAGLATFLALVFLKKRTGFLTPRSELGAEGQTTR